MARLGWAFVAGSLGLAGLTGCTTANFEYEDPGSPGVECGDGCEQSCPVGTELVAGQCVAACGPWNVDLGTTGAAAIVVTEAEVISVGTNTIDSGRGAETWLVARDICGGKPAGGTQPWAKSPARAVAAVRFNNDIFVTGQVTEPAGVFLSHVSGDAYEIVEERALTLAAVDPVVEAMAASKTGVWLVGTAPDGPWAAKADDVAACSLSLSGNNVKSARLTVSDGSAWFVTTDGASLWVAAVDDASCDAGGCGCKPQQMGQVKLPAALSNFGLSSLQRAAGQLYVAGSAGGGNDRRGVVLQLSPEATLSHSLELELSSGRDDVAAVVATESGLFVAASSKLESENDTRGILRRYPLPLPAEPDVDVELGRFRAISMQAGPGTDLVVAGEGSDAARLFRCTAQGGCTPSSAPVSSPQ